MDLVKLAEKLEGEGFLLKGISFCMPGVTPTATAWVHMGKIYIEIPGVDYLPEVPIENSVKEVFAELLRDEITESERRLQDLME